MFKKFAEFTPTTWITLAALALFGILVLMLTKNKKRFTTKMIAQAALCIALAFVLSYVRLYRMPQGGSVTLASMLPIFLFAYLYGPAPGILTGMAYGLLQFIQGGDMVHPVQFLLDYPLAFAMLGMAGCLRTLPDILWGVPSGLLAGMILGTLGRAACAVASGVIFFGQYAPVGQNPLFYSLVYNLSYLSVDLLICLVIAMMPGVINAVKRLQSVR